MPRNKSEKHLYDKPTFDSKTEKEVEGVSFHSSSLAREDLMAAYKRLKDRARAAKKEAQVQGESLMTTSIDHNLMVGSALAYAAMVGAKYGKKQK
jgi:hypothetical protein